MIHITYKDMVSPVFIIRSSRTSIFQALIVRDFSTNTLQPRPLS